MKLRHDWSEIARKAWSFRLMILAGFFSGLEALLPVLNSYVAIPGGLFAVISLLITLLAAWARLVAQKNMSGGDK